ncbi:MAG: hypothetical protein KDD45_16155 [Bdellovibrionales bacterium]|nr:hypothetical protein [Bdellovibrionales bacterium]
MLILRREQTNGKRDSSETRGLQDLKNSPSSKFKEEFLAEMLKLKQ